MQHLVQWPTVDVPANYSGHNLADARSNDSFANLTEITSHDNSVNAPS